MASNEGGTWRTVGGRRIFIKDGESLDNAMKNSGKFISIKKEKNNSTPIKNTNKVDDFLNKNETIDEVKKITNEKGRLNCCKEVSEKIKKMANENNIEAEIKQVTVFANGEMGTINGHYVVEIDNNLYDYTGKQFLGSNNPNDVELRKYTINNNNFYSESENISNIEQAQEYTSKNKDKIIIYKEK